MTREEAIKFLTLMRKAVSNFEEYGHDKASLVIGCDKAEAIDMAIEALNNITDGKDLIIKGAKGIQDGLYNIKDGKLFKYKAKGGTVRTYPIVPSADAEFADLPDIPRAYYERIVGKMAHEINMLKEQLELADGEWIDSGEYPWSKCNKCGYTINCYYEEEYHYCPNCGARMKGGAEE